MNGTYARNREVQERTDGKMDGEDTQQIAAAFHKQPSKHIISGEFPFHM